MAFRNQFTELMQADMYSWFFESYDQIPAVYPQIFEVKQIDAGFDKHTTGVGMGKLSVRKEGSKIIASNPMEGWTVYAKVDTYSDAVYFTMETVEDVPAEKVANILRDTVATWAPMVVATKEESAAKVFNKGGLTAGHEIFNGTVTGVQDDPSGDLAYDGYPFFNLSGNDRSSKGGGTYYNGLSASALSADNLEAAYKLMANTNNRNERDEIIALRPDVLVVPPSLTFTAKKLLESDRIVGSANNDINTVQNLVQPIEWHYLTDSDAWFIGKAKMGLQFLERKAPVIDFYQNEEDKKYYATIDARWGIKAYNWRYWVGANFSTS